MTSTSTPRTRWVQEGMPNVRPMKTQSSDNIDFKKCMEVTTAHSENQNFEIDAVKYDRCHLNKGISNIGGPGNFTPASYSDVTMIGLFGIRKKRRTFDTGSGLDKKHGSYDRYLARKKGWIFRNEFKQCYQ